MKIESGTTKRSNQSIFPLGLELLSLVLILWTLDEDSRGKVKGNYFLGGVVDPPTSSYGPCYGLNSKGKSTLNSKFIREAHGSLLA